MVSISCASHTVVSNVTTQTAEGSAWNQPDFFHDMLGDYRPQGLDNDGNDNMCSGCARNRRVR